MSFDDPFYNFFSVLILIAFFTFLAGALFYYIRKPIGKALCLISFLCGFVAWSAAAIYKDRAMGIVWISIPIAIFILLDYLKKRAKSERAERILKYIWVVAVFMAIIFAVIMLPLILK